MNTAQLAGTALIFEGGGMRASATAGTVVTLLERGIEFPFACGISAGATHAFNYASRDRWRAEAAFTEFAADPHFGGLRSFVGGTGFFNAHYIYEEASLPGGPFRFDFDSFCASTTEVAISAFCVETASSVTWTRAEMPDLPAALVRARASSTMPGLMPPVHIDGRTYVDGALGPSGGIPLDAAIEAGYERFVAVLSRPRDYVKAKPARGVHAALARTPAVAQAVEGRWRRYNRSRARLAELEAEGRAFLYYPEGEVVSNREMDGAKLRASYEAGYEQAQSWADELEQWLGA